MASENEPSLIDTPGESIYQADTSGERLIVREPAPADHPAYSLGNRKAIEFCYIGEWNSLRIFTVSSNDKDAYIYRIKVEMDDTPNDGQFVLVHARVVQMVKEMDYLKFGFLRANINAVVNYKP